jgi:hypothetical protein
VAPVSACAGGKKKGAAASAFGILSPLPLGDMLASRLGIDPAGFWPKLERLELGHPVALAPKTTRQDQGSRSLCLPLGRQNSPPLHPTDPRREFANTCLGHRYSVARPSNVCSLFYSISVVSRVVKKCRAPYTPRQRVKISQVRIPHSNSQQGLTPSQSFSRLLIPLIQTRKSDCVFNAYGRL